MHPAIISTTVTFIAIDISMRAFDNKIGPFDQIVDHLHYEDAGKDSYVAEKACDSDAFGQDLCEYVAWFRSDGAAYAYLVCAFFD